MPRITYSEQFKRDAVTLYENTDGASINRIAAELGVSRGSLQHWLTRYGTRPRSTKSVSPEGSDRAATGIGKDEKIRELERENHRLREERDILRKAAKYFGRRDDLVSRFRFVDDFRTEYSVKRLCEVLMLNRSSYYKWKSSASRRRERLVADAALGARIRAIFSEHDGCYGAKRITAELNAPGRRGTPLNNRACSPASRASVTVSQRADGAASVQVVNHKRVARIMRCQGISGFTKKRRVRTTVPAPSAPRFPDLVRRNFAADRANRVYVGDITYLPVSGGSTMYLATVIDCYSRRLVGFSIADHMRADLVCDALVMAKNQRGSLDGAVFHSDHGSVYSSSMFRRLCSDFEVRQSMGAVGASADNSLAESFNASMKREVLKDRKSFVNQLSCRREVFRWCVRYNSVRRHSWCGHQAPEVFEAGVSGSLLNVS
ncbi:IS3 family transposase [Corynebacterium kalidii]|uniref:IS3 family transposase n=1 Tax=Corynebacterium kalidii TaxID=2931982 RepID=A0A9X2AZL6_9CORY|nr:IS3 family transposase [Corynebacterium kalidii]MCJ7858950.1 IS3 family transposase [Corynebacterium kalidii]MCJ7858956.1 IS3 family transposase [Corynebacterium kalidii]MCJ7858958.1 IS3 family transposase [Corynebacterium kalidii]